MRGMQTTRGISSGGTRRGKQTTRRISLCHSMGKDETGRTKRLQKPESIDPDLIERILQRIVCVCLINAARNMWVTDVGMEVR